MCVEHKHAGISDLNPSFRITALPPPPAELNTNHDVDHIPLKKTSAGIGGLITDSTSKLSCSLGKTEAMNPQVNGLHQTTNASDNVATGLLVLLSQIRFFRLTCTR